MRHISQMCLRKRVAVASTLCFTNLRGTGATESWLKLRATFGLKSFLLATVGRASFDARV